MKRFLVFKWTEYAAWGGFNDLEGEFDTVEEARACLSESGESDGHVVDTHTGEEILCLCGAYLQKKMVERYFGYFCQEILDVSTAGEKECPACGRRIIVREVEDKA